MLTATLFVLFLVICPLQTYTQSTKIDEALKASQEARQRVQLAIQGILLANAEARESSKDILATLEVGLKSCFENLEEDLQLYHLYRCIAYNEALALSSVETLNLPSLNRTDLALLKSVNAVDTILLALHEMPTNAIASSKGQAILSTLKVALNSCDENFKKYLEYTVYYECVENNTELALASLDELAGQQPAKFALVDCQLLSRFK